MKIENIRKKIGTSIMFLSEKTLWKMEFYIKVDGVNYPFVVYLKENDILSYDPHWRLTLSKEEEKELLFAIKESEAFKNIQEKIINTENKLKEIMKVNDIVIEGGRYDGTYNIYFRFTSPVTNDFSYELMDSFEETLKKLNLNEKGIYFHLLFKIGIENDKRCFIPVEKYHLKTATHRNFLKDLSTLLSNHPSVRLKLLTL